MRDTRSPDLLRGKFEVGSFRLVVFDCRGMIPFEYDYDSLHNRSMLQFEELAAFMVWRRDEDSLEQTLSRVWRIQRPAVETAYAEETAHAESSVRGAEQRQRFRRSLPIYPSPRLPSFLPFLSSLLHKLTFLTYPHSFASQTSSIVSRSSATILTSTTPPPPYPSPLSTPARRRPQFHCVPRN